jgi:hypothetical protein
MRRGRPSGLSPGEHQDTVRQLIRAVLNEGTLGSAYGQQLLETHSQWLAHGADDPAISALPGLVCQANGGDPHQAEPVTTAWQLLRLAAKLFDDVEDGEIGCSSAEVVNLATGLLFLAQLALAELSRRGVPSDQVDHLCQTLNRAGLRACAGQHADLARQVEKVSIDPDTWLEIALAKSGEPFAWAAWAGALVAGAGEQTLTDYREYGRHLGVLLQVADDFGVWHPKGVGDLAAGRRCTQRRCTQRLNLAVCYARSVMETEERSRLETLLAQAARGDSAAEAQARQWLIDLGAQSYLLVVARVQYQQAMMALQNANCSSPQLAAVLDHLLPAPGRVEK